VTLLRIALAYLQASFCPYVVGLLSRAQRSNFRTHCKVALVTAIHHVVSKCTDVRPLCTSTRCQHVEVRSNTLLVLKDPHVLEAGVVFAQVSNRSCRCRLHSRPSDRFILVYSAFKRKRIAHRVT